MMNALGVILQVLSSLISSATNMAKVLRRKNKFPREELGGIEKSPKAGVGSPALELFWGIGFVYSNFSIHDIIAEAMEGLYGRSANLPEGG
ncbi:hypothetical protein R50912_03795 [Paenibacillus sp. FSL R5-0912]|nr:hypothetical protein R50912_03795 [Paenibacillus sp. FSL R5-0912]